jgi:hypothetical protein
VFIPRVKFWGGDLNLILPLQPVKVAVLFYEFTTAKKYHGVALPADARRFIGSGR